MTEPQDVLAEALHETDGCVCAPFEDAEIAGRMVTFLAARGYALVRTPETLDVELRRAAQWLVDIHADAVSVPRGSALWEDLQSLKTALAASPAPDPGAGLREALGYPGSHPGCGQGCEDCLDVGCDHHKKALALKPEAIRLLRDDWPLDARMDISVGEFLVTLAASPAPDPGAGLREADFDALDALVTQSNHSFPERVKLHAALRAALAPSAEPPETTG